MTAAGKCKSSEDKCLAGTYCPATEDVEVDCKPCDASIISGQGCNCADDTKIDNCQTCNGAICSLCIKGTVVNADGTSCEACSANCSDCTATDTCTTCATGFYLDGKVCAACTVDNCSSCSSADTCTACKDKFTLVGKTCVASCEAASDCTVDKTFCDLKEKVCKACGADCDKCKSESICGVCTAPKMANINGVCEDACTTTPAVDGQYCKNGTAEACAEGLTSECKCAAAKNCASCVEDKSKCDTCLPGFKKDGDECKQCAEGFEAFETLCLVPGGSGSSAKLSGGAIAGIVIGVIVVVGGVGGGLAYYFIKKNKK